MKAYFNGNITQEILFLVVIYVDMLKIWLPMVCFTTWHLPLNQRHNIVATNFILCIYVAISIRGCELTVF